MSTPLHKADQLKRALGLTADLYLKREDLHEYGSHKGRSIPFMIDRFLGQGMTDFVISSSGNAALAAAKYISKHNKNSQEKIRLKIFVGEKITENKLARLKKLTNGQIILEKVNNPKQSAFTLDKNGTAKNLRQSTDDLALLGYEELAEELAEIKNLSAVFIPTSSGTTAQGLWMGFAKLKIQPQIHIVQTTACYPLVKSAADYGDKNNLSEIAPTEKSLANAIVDKIAHRQNEIAKIIQTSRGGAWVATDSDILEAIKQTKDAEQIDISPNSALSVAGLKLAEKSGQNFSGSIVCLITGE